MGCSIVTEEEETDDEKRSKRIQLNIDKIACVYIHKILFKIPFPPLSIFLYYFATVREADHANLCKFVGASIVVPHVCILTEYCPKGSLSDVLLNDDVPLNWAFRFVDLSYLSQYTYVLI